MPYELTVSQVGPAEYPLMEVLRETIFGEVGHRSMTSFSDLLEGRRDVLALIAHLEGNPVGFKIGCESERPGVYYSRSGGVLKEYRRLGLGRRMQEWQHQFCRSRGYRQVYFNSFNRFKGMMQFGLASGFLPVAAGRRDEGEMSFKFVKDLTAPPPPIDTGDAAAPSLDALRREIDHRNAAALSGALSDGFDMTGIRHDSSAGRTMIIFELACTQFTSPFQASSSALAPAPGIQPGFDNSPSTAVESARSR